MRIKTETAVGIFILLAILTFLYLTFQIGIFRFDHAQYAPYTVCFKDANGLTKKTDVKIAGVKVGWIDQVDLLPESNKVAARLMLQKDFVLRSNAQVMIRQDGLLGTRYVEIMPGAAPAEQLEPGSSLKDEQFVSAVALDELLVRMQKIAQNIENITDKLNAACSAPQNVQAINDVVNHVNVSAEKIAQVSDSIHGLVTTQQQKITETVDHICALTQDFKDKMPNYDKAAARIVNRVEQTADSVYKTSQEIQSLTEYITKEPGGLGKFLCGDEGSSLRRSITTLQRCAGIVQSWSFGSIGHIEYLRPLHDASHANVKAYFNFQWDFLPSTALIAGVTTSLNGYAHSSSKKRCLQKHGYTCADKKGRITHLTGNFQLGYRFGQFGFRAGLFENSAGIALDCMIDFSHYVDSSWFKPAVTSSFEVFDWRGSHRCYPGTEPHLKWLNRMWITPQLYFVAGLDDIANTHRSGFIGVGYNLMF